MIYTVTFNPSLDYIVTVDDFTAGKTNRTTSELMLPGGKGINVSTVLSNLGVDNTAIYYSAGFVGDEITRLIRKSGINAEEIRIDKGCSRINLKIRNIEGTEVNGMGPDISGSDIELLYDKLDKAHEGDFVVLAGSIPVNLPDSIYSDIMMKLEGRGVRFVVDTTGDRLMKVLPLKPFLIKPNNDELGELFGVTLSTRESVIPYAEKLVQMGAENVIVSMAGDGAAYVSAKGNKCMMAAPKGELVNGVGAGDSMVAGFIAGYLEKGDPDYAFRLGLSAGSASAFSEYLATKDEIFGIMASL
jgi:1-phosphofructokinase